MKRAVLFGVLLWLMAGSTLAEGLKFTFPKYYSGKTCKFDTPNGVVVKAAICYRMDYGSTTFVLIVFGETPFLMLKMSHGKLDEVIEYYGVMT